MRPEHLMKTGFPSTRRHRSRTRRCEGTAATSPEMPCRPSSASQRSPEDRTRQRASLWPRARRLITLIPLYRVPLVGLNGRKLVPGLQGFCHGAVPFLICSISREATFLTKASLFISLTHNLLCFHERLRKRARLRQRLPFVPPPLRYSRFQRLDPVLVRYCYS